MVNMLESGSISEHNYNIGCRIAEVMCGGKVDAGSPVDEQWLLDGRVQKGYHFATVLKVARLPCPVY